MLEYHKHTNTNVKVVLRIQCVLCQKVTQCDMPMVHICECGSRLFSWDPQTSTRPVDKMKEVPYVAPAVMEPAHLTTTEVAPEPHRSAYAQERRRHLRSFPR